MANPQSRIGAISQLEAIHRHGNYARSPTSSSSSSSSSSSRTPSSPTFEQLLRVGEPTRFSGQTAPAFGRVDHDMEATDTTPNHKKSVLAKVKEKARRWRHSLSKKKHGEDGNVTPSWGVSLEEDEEEDAEYLGAPMYESEMAPEGLKETARQHPRAVPVISEKHVLTSSVNNSHAEQKSPGGNKPTTASNLTGKLEKEESPKAAQAETLIKDKLAPSGASNATQSDITTQVQSLTVLTPEPPGPAAPMGHAAKGTVGPYQEAVPNSARTAIKQATPAPPAVQTGPPNSAPASSDYAKYHEQIWDKGVSVKEYIMHKLEPGEEERALSQVISQAISPRKNQGEGGMVEKMKEAVSSFLRNEDSHTTSAAAAAATTNSNTTSTTGHHSATNSSTNIPISTNAHEVTEEEIHGRILQAN